MGGFQPVSQICSSGLIFPKFWAEKYEAIIRANSFFPTSKNSSHLRVHPDAKAPGHLVRGFAAVHCDSMK